MKSPTRSWWPGVAETHSSDVSGPPMVTGPEMREQPAIVPTRMSADTTAIGRRLIPLRRVDRGFRPGIPSLRTGAFRS